MKASEFDEINNTWRIIDNKLKQVCLDNKIDYYDYVGVFVNLLSRYNSLIHKKKTIESLDFKNLLNIRAILNKVNISRKEVELIEVEKEIVIYRNKLFNWLNKTETPYFFILNPYFKYGYFEDKYKYLKNINTGIQNLNIAIQYANYKINLNN